MGRDGLLGPVVGTEVLVLKRCWTAKDRVKLEPDSFEYMTCCGCGRHVERFDEKRKLVLKKRRVAKITVAGRASLESSQFNLQGVGSKLRSCKCLWYKVVVVLVKKEQHKFQVRLRLLPSDHFS